MKVLGIIPEKVHITFSMEAGELDLLSKALSMCKFEYNGESKEDLEIKEFFVNDFSKIISELIAELQGETNGT